VVECAADAGGDDFGRFHVFGPDVNDANRDLFIPGCPQYRRIHSRRRYSTEIWSTLLRARSGSVTP